MSILESDFGVLVSVQVGKPQTLTGSGEQRSWTTGIIKKSVVGPIRLGELNLAGDGQADSVHHGGVDKAVCVYSADHYPFWRQELQMDDLAFGGFGENLTVGGLAEHDVCIGDIWRIGDTTVQVSQPRQPCWKLARRWGIKDFAQRVQQNGRTGWYLRVLCEGFIESGMKIQLAQRLHSDWSVAQANFVMHHDKTNDQSAGRLASIPTLSTSWKATLKKRSKGVQPHETGRLDGES